jgi:ABC-type glycerol-3-phosphate transport system permease component
MASTTAPPLARRRALPRAQRQRLLVHAGAWLSLIVFVLPIIWSISASFKNKAELFETIPGLFPREPTLANYHYTLQQIGNFPVYFLNSTIVTGGTVALTVFSASLAGYAFGRLRFRGRDLIFYSLVLQLFIPRAGSLMATYEVMYWLGLRNSLVGLILLFSGHVAVPVFIMRQTFFNVPGEFEDAALIDGCNRWQMFWRVIAPMGTAGMVLVAIFTFIDIWGEYLITLTMMDDPIRFTLAVGVANLNLTTARFTEAEIIPYGAQAAAYLLAAAPCALVFVLLQRWFVRGLSEGLKF